MEKWDEWGDKPGVVRANFRAWDRDPAKKPRSHRIRERAAAIAAAPSSSFLDAIYRSIDDDQTGKTRSTLRRVFTETSGNSLPPLHRPPGKLGSLRIPQQYPPAAAAAGAPPRRRSADRRAHGASTSGSSESSYGGFSEPDTARRTARDGGEKKAGSIRSRLRQSRIYCELKKAGTPASPGSRLAVFLNSLFPPKARPAPPPAAATCSSAPPIARSCLGIGVGGRSVRFDAAPAARERTAAEEREDRRRREAAMAVLGLGLGKGGGREEEEEEDDDAASCSSSDLFELEDLDGCGCAGVGRYRDELPVYGTTRVESNMAIARGLLV